MNKHAFLFLSAMLLCAPAMASEGDTESFKLKDGSTLYINERGDMKMIDSHGNGISMRDGVPMEAEDGRIFMMKNNALWERMRRGTLNPKFP